MVQLALLCAAALAFAVGGIFMKNSEGLTRPGPSALLFLLFWLGAALQALAMRHAEMSVVYIFVLGLETILAFLFGVRLFHEPAGASRILAVALIIAGMLLLERPA